jgi:hypothetical protein
MLNVESKLDRGKSSPFRSGFSPRGIEEGSALSSLTSLGTSYTIVLASYL